MSALLPPSTIGWCPASFGSFLPGPDGPAGAPPGQALRSGALMELPENALIELPENREPKQDPYYKVSTFEGNPVHHNHRARALCWRASAIVHGVACLVTIDRG